MNVVLMASDLCCIPTASVLLDLGQLLEYRHCFSLYRRSNNADPSTIKMSLRQSLRYMRCEWPEQHLKPLS